MKFKVYHEMMIWLKKLKMKLLSEAIALFLTVKFLNY